MWLLLIAFVLLASCDETRIAANPSADTYRIESFSLRIGDKVETIRVAPVSDAFFAQARMQPSVGRLFLPTEFGGASGRVAVISHALWQRKLGADPSWIGRIIQLNGQDFTIVGIMPANFAFPPDVEAWIPN